MNKYMIGLMILGASIPIILSLTVYSMIDCTKLYYQNYQAWLEQGNKGTFNDMVQSCNNYHPLPLYMLLPVSPILAVIIYTMFDKESQTTKSESSSP